MSLVRRFGFLSRPTAPPNASAGCWTESPTSEEWLTPCRFSALLAAMLAATFPRVLTGARTFVFRDFGMFSYPVAHFHRESIWRGEIPLWNSLNCCGVPFLAQWNTMVLYPPSLLYLLLPLQWSLSFFCLAHLFWGGLGMYFLAATWTRHHLAAALAGVVFSFNGLALNFLMWPSHVATLSWLPWVLWLGPKAWRSGGRTLVWAILAAAMQMLAGGPETILLTWAILVLLAIADGMNASHSSLVRRQIALRFLGLALVVALICAAQLLPFLSLVARSQRDSGYSAASHNWSMPFWGWANFLVPLFRTSPLAPGVYFQNGQYWTSSYYVGIGTVLLSLAAIRRASFPRVRLLAGIVLLGLVLAWGDISPLFCAIRTCFPVLGFVRYPVKFVLAATALLPLLAACGLAAYSSSSTRPGRFEYGTALALVLLVGGIIAVDWSNPPRADIWQATCANAASRAAFLVGIVALTACWARSRGLFRILLGLLLLTSFWADLATQVPSQNPTAPPSVYSQEAINPQLATNPGPTGDARAFVSPDARNRLSQNPLPDPAENYLRNRLAARANCNLLDGRAQVDGFFSLLPRATASLNRLLYQQQTNACAGLLDFMGVSHSTKPGGLTGWATRPNALPLITAGQRPVFAEDQAVLDAFLDPRVDWRQTVFLPRNAQTAVSALRMPNVVVSPTRRSHQELRFQAQADGACLIVVSQTYDPGWKAYVDGRPARIWRANCAFQAIQVPAGRHEVRLVYRDAGFPAGLALSGLGLVSCLVLWAKTRKAPPEREAHAT